MKVFYVDRVRGADIALLAGPFQSEDIARKYELAAMAVSFGLSDRSQFDRYGVVAIDPEGLAPGQYNDLLDVDPADLVGEFA